MKGALRILFIATQKLQSREREYTQKKQSVLLQNNLEGIGINIQFHLITQLL